MPRLERGGRNLDQFADSVQEALQTFRGTRGDRLDKALTIRDAVSVGLLALNGAGGAGGGGFPGVGLPPAPEQYKPDLTPPPTPTVTSVTAGITNIYIELVAPVYLQGHGHKKTNFYGAKRPAGALPKVFTDAILIGEAFDARTIYVHPTEPATRWALWVTFTTNDGVESLTPAGGANGFETTTGQDVALLLEVLTNQITEDQLFSTLCDRIDLIDGPPTLGGSVNQRIVQGDAANASLITTVQAVGVAANANSVENPGFVLGGGGWDASLLFDSSTGGCPLNAPSTRVLRSNQRDVINGALVRVAPGEVIDFSVWLASVTPTNTSCNIMVQCFRRDGSVHDAYNYPSIASQAAGLTTWRQIFGTWTVPDAATDVGFYRLDLQVDQAPSGGPNVVWWSQPAAVKRNATGRAIAASVQTEATARAGADGQLFAQYTVKLDVNGYVSGFGLASTGGSAAPTSSFIVRADSFAIASPSGPGITPIVPFIVRTTPGVVNGVSYPSGVYIDAAYILDLTSAIARLGVAWIDDAKIGAVSAGKLTAGDGTIGGLLKSANYVSGASGWAVQPGGFAEFSNIVIRGAVYTGTIFANAGTIGNITIGLNDLRSSNYVGGSAGFRINADGSAEFYNITARGNITANSLNAATGTLGSVTVSATGSVKGGQTDYQTGTGFFLGYSGGAYKFSIGDPANSFMAWDGANLMFNKPQFDSFTASIPGGDIHAGFVGNPGTYGSRTVVVSGGRAPYSYLWAISNGGNNLAGLSAIWISSGTSLNATVTVAGGPAPYTGTGGTVTTNNYGRLICFVSDSNGRVTLASVAVTGSHTSSAPDTGGGDSP